MLLMVYFITDSKIMFNICYGIIIGLPVRSTPNQDKKKKERKMRTKLPEGFASPLPASMGPFSLGRERVISDCLANRLNWESIWNEHKIIACRYWAYIYAE